MNWALVIHTMAPEHLLLLGIVVTVLTSLADERPQLAASVAIVTALAVAASQIPSMRAAMAKEKATAKPT